MPTPMRCSSSTGARVRCVHCSDKFPFEYGDYLIIPRGVIYQIDFDTDDNRLLYAESKDPIYTPKRYRNHFGQLLEQRPLHGTRL